MAFDRALVGIRTPNLLIRSQMLYPIELRMHVFPRLQGLGTTLERAANIAIFVENSNQKWNYPSHSYAKNTTYTQRIVLNCDTIYEKIYPCCYGHCQCHRSCFK